MVKGTKNIRGIGYCFWNVMRGVRPMEVRERRKGVLWKGQGNEDLELVKGVFV